MLDLQHESLIRDYLCNKAMPLRQTTGFVQSLLQLAGLDWVAPDFSTLCRSQQTLNVRLPYRGCTGPLNLLIPSHGL